jgi:hypothetical protein
VCGLLFKQPDAAALIGTEKIAVRGIGFLKNRATIFYQFAS